MIDQDLPRSFHRLGDLYTFISQDQGPKKVGWHICIGIRYPWSVEDSVVIHIDDTWKLRVVIEQYRHEQIHGQMMEN